MNYFNELVAFYSDIYNVKTTIIVVIAIAVLFGFTGALLNEITDRLKAKVGIESARNKVLMDAVKNIHNEKAKLIKENSELKEVNLSLRNELDQANREIEVWDGLFDDEKG